MKISGMKVELHQGHHRKTSSRKYIFGFRTRLDKNYKLFYSQLRSLVNAIRKSGQRRALFQKICEDLNIEHLELIIDCATRWNSSFDMLERALKMHLVIDLKCILIYLFKKSSFNFYFRRLIVLFYFPATRM